MTEENNEAKEDAINKLTSFSWQRKLNERNERNPSPKCVNNESEPFWKPVAKPNSESQFNNEMKKEFQTHQTHVFKTKNELMAAPKQPRDDCHYAKLPGTENTNTNNEKKFVTVKETSSDQKYERQSKNRNDHYGQNYRRDEKENVNIYKNIHRGNPGNQQNYSQNQNHFKRDDKNQNFHRDVNVGNESSNHNLNASENFVKKDQQNFNQHQSRSYNQNNRGYHRNQEKFNQANNYHRNDAKNRNNYQNLSRHQYFHQNDDKTERKGEPFKKNINTNGNSISHMPSNYSKLATGISPDNPTSGVHYQRTFSPKTNANVANNQSMKSVVSENFIPQTELFAQLDLSSENCTPDVEDIYSGKNNCVISSQFTNFTNADNFSNDLFSNQFTAGINEPIPTVVHQNDTFRTNILLNQSPNIPVTAVNYIDNYMPSSQPLISDNFTDCSYSNQMVTTSMLAKNDQSQFVDQFALNNDIPTTFSSLSPDVADFIPRKNRNQNTNQMDFSSPIVGHQQNRNQNTAQMDFSSPIVGHQQNRNQNTAQMEFSSPIVGHQKNLIQNPNQMEFSSPIVGYQQNRIQNTNQMEFSSPIVGHQQNRFQNTNQMEFSSPIRSHQQNRIQNTNQMEFSSPIVGHQQERNLENSYIFSYSSPNNNQSCNTNWLSQSNISNCNEGMNSGDENFQSCVGTPTNFQQSNSPSEGLNDIFNRQHTAVSDTPNNSQTFNFNGRRVNLSGKENQTDVSKHPPSYDNVQNFYSCQDNSTGDQFNYDLRIDSGTNNYSENLNFSNQQLSNILKIANLNLNQEPSSISASASQRINDMLQMSNSNVNVNENNIMRQTNASILSQSVINSSNQPVCEVMQNSRVNVMPDYYNKKPAADVANNLKCSESEDMNSKLEIVAQQLFNVNKYVTTSTEMNARTIPTKDSVSDTNSAQFNMATFKRYKNEMEKYRQSGNFSNDREINTLSSSNSKIHYENLFTPTSIETSKPYDSFSSQAFSNSNFIPNQEQQFDIGSRYNDGNRNNNPMLPTEFVSNVKTSEANTANNFQNNYGRSNVPMSSIDRYRYANANIETNMPPQNRQTSFRNEFTRTHNNKRMFNNQARVTNNKLNSMTINVVDDCFINFNQKGRQEDHGRKFNPTIVKAPSVGILKKSQKSILDTSIQFYKSPKDQSSDDSCDSSKESSPLNKRVSFLLENDQ